MSRVFPMPEWAPTPISRAMTDKYASLGGADATQEKVTRPPWTTGFRKRLGSLPLGAERSISVDFNHLSMVDHNQQPREEAKLGGCIRGLLRRASISIKSVRPRRHSHADQLTRPSTSHSHNKWHRLRQATSFSRASRILLPHEVQDLLEEGDCPYEKFLSPIPGNGSAPPIIPLGTGKAARATAAAQNQYHRQLLSPDEQQMDRESGIGISLTQAEVAQYQDTSLSRVDFISCLPSELSIQILAHLDHASLRNTTRVSRNWARVSQSQHIWREAFLREKSKAYAMSGPIVPGTGLGLPHVKPDSDWRDLYRIKQQLENNWREGKAEPIYLNGHLDSIYCVQFDESKIITGSRDKTIRVWDLRTYTCTLVIGPPDVVHDPTIMVGEDGLPQHYATVPDRPREAESIPETVSFPIHHNASILCLQYDSEILVTGSSDSTCIVHSIKNGFEPIRRLHAHTAAVLDLAFDDQHIVTCSKDVSICVWDRETGALLKQLRGHTGPVNAVQMRGNTIVSCSGDFRVKLWHIDSGKNIREFFGHTKGLACSQFSEDSRFIASAGNDKIIRIWDANTGECLQKITAHENLVRSLHIDSASGRLISGSYDQDIKVFEMETGRLLLDFPKWHSSWVLGAKSDYRRIISTGQDPKILIMDFGRGIHGIEKLESC
ncbi:hypothetical protein B7463_g4554, partial [Scytalidium lignicola]